MTRKSFIKKHPVLAYYALTFAISWGGILMMIGMGGILGTEEISDSVMPFVYLATLLGPSVAGLLLTGLVDGKAGYRELLSRLLAWRMGARWYAAALLTVPFLVSLILFGLSRTSSVYLPAIITTDDRAGLLLTGIVTGLMVGFFEELGWTGFVLPRLRQRFGVLTSGLIVGLLWGAWHFPLFLGGISSSGPLHPYIYLSVLLFSFLPAYRVLMVWAYEHTRSLFVMILMHAPLTASQLVLIPSGISGAQVVTYNLLFAAALWLIVALVAFVRGGRFWQPSGQKQMAEFNTKA